IILKALKKVPHDRYGDMLDLADALRLFAGETTVPLPDTPSASKPLPMTGQLSKITTQKEIPAVEKDVHSPVSGAKLYLQDYDVSFDLSDRGEETAYVIGRSSPKNPVDIDLNPFEAGKVGISRRHARIYQQDGDWFIEDLNSTNGTRLNRNKLTPQTSTTLRHEDVIRFGLLKAVFINSA
ncbi:MAG: FHA domain-containing protein, partial [Anaerolineae bacterium]|nr:FHA domain-containing protein [Anaerolineae bacterium]